MKKLIVTALAVAATAAFAVPSAHAGDTATCKFTALMGNLQPWMNPIIDPSGVGQTGTYDFGGSGTCVTVEGDVGDPISNTGVFPIEITSHGSWQQIVCSTGFLTGFPPDTVIQGLPEGPVYLAYNLVTAVGTGPMVIGIGSTAQHSTVRGAGVVNLIPVPNEGDCIQYSTFAFSVTGAFTLVAT